MRLKQMSAAQQVTAEVLTLACFIQLVIQSHASGCPCQALLGSIFVRYVHGSLLLCLYAGLWRSVLTVVHCFNTLQFLGRVSSEKDAAIGRFIAL
jgi:hypothetical protein